MYVYVYIYISVYVYIYYNGRQDCLPWASAWYAYFYYSVTLIPWYAYFYYSCYYVVKSVVCLFLLTFFYYSVTAWYAYFYYSYYYCTSSHMFHFTTHILLLLDICVIRWLHRLIFVWWCDIVCHHYTCSILLRIFYCYLIYVSYVDYTDWYLYDDVT